jgi:hypothetical protein
VQAHAEPAVPRRNMRAGGERNEKIGCGRLVFALEEPVSHDSCMQKNVDVSHCWSRSKDRQHLVPRFYCLFNFRNIGAKLEHFKNYNEI